MQSSMLLQQRSVSGASARVSRAARRSFRPFAVSAPVQAKATIDYELDPDNASILVAGGGGVALNTTRRLKNMGSWVWQLQRTDVRRKEIEGMMAIVAKGDALNTDELQKVFDSIEDVDAVVCSLGGSVADPRVDSQGVINVINGAIKKGVKKFVLVTSLGCGNTKDTVGEKVYETLKPVLVEKDKAEAALQAQDKMAWVIVRPGGLTNDPASGSGVLTESTKVVGSVSRDDVAAQVVKALFSKKADGKVFSCIDKNKQFAPVEFEPAQL